MPDGATHYRYYKKGYPIMLPLSIILTLIDWKMGVGLVVGYSIHRYCDNDWDIMGTNNAEGRAVNELPILGHFIYGISSTYGSIFRRHHRSFITHFPFVSTVIRLIFVLSPIFIIGDYSGVNFIGDGWYKFWVCLWVGLSIADTIHWYLDKNFGD